MSVFRSRLVLELGSRGNVHNLTTTPIGEIGLYTCEARVSEDGVTEPLICGIDVTGNADDPLFLESSLGGIGWDEIGDLG